MKYHDYQGEKTKKARDTRLPALTAVRQAVGKVVLVIPVILLKLMGPKTKQKILAHLVEFFLIGLVMGVAEDLLAIYFATDAVIDWEVFKVGVFSGFPIYGDQ